MKKKIKNMWASLSLVLALILLGLSAFTVLDDDDDFEISKNLEIFYTVVRDLNIYYVDKPDPGKLITENINIMLKGLDPYTVFIPETRVEDYKAMSTGEYGGVGASIVIRNRKVIITDIYDSSPSQTAGLFVGDEILLISGKTVENLKMDQIGALLKGSANTDLSMKIRRVGSSKILNFNLKRKDIKIKNVPYFSMLDNKVGYIRLSGFTKTASEEVINAFNELKTRGMEKLIFDLRGNPGGLLIEAVKIVNIFVKKNELVVKMIGRVEKRNQTFKTMSEPLDTLINVAVLVNSMSASASEIVSGALQDLDRALIVGTKSFGKGLVQQVFPLIYNSQLKLTIAKYYIPSGRCIQAVDYSNRNADGSVGKVPDSLVTEFRTKNGRKVYDGGGISPDLLINSKKTSQLISQLESEYIFFDFLNNYLNSKSLIFNNINEINSDDNLFNEFLLYVQEVGFVYKTKREKQLTKLIEIAKEEKAYTDIEPEVLILQKKLAHNLERDLTKFKEEINFILERDIASRTLYRIGKIEYQLTNDKQLTEAIKLISDSKKVEEYLNN